MDKIWNQKISEYVGKGHPDIIADKMAKMINDKALISATEIVVNKLGAYITGETSFKNDVDMNKAKQDISSLIIDVIKDYNMFETGVNYHNFIKMNFVKQNGMLEKRDDNNLAGDQEVVYYTKLDEQDVHFHLREIDEMVNKISTTMDYKTIINMSNKTFGLSISKTHINFEEIKDLIIKESISRFGKDIDIKITEFNGGSIFNDTGVTGRKLIVEQSGCGYPHGGGAVYGKSIKKTAVYAHKLARQCMTSDKTVIVTYRPGDELNRPTFIGGGSNE